MLLLVVPNCALTYVTLAVVQVLPASMATHEASTAGELAVAYAVYKAATPIRWPATIGLTTYLAKFTTLR